MKKKLIIVWSLISLSLFQTSPVVLADEADRFADLEKLEIGVLLPQALRQKENETTAIEYPDVLIYSFTSSRFANPHAVHVKDDKVIFIQLTVPPEQEKRYHDLLNTLAVPDQVRLPKTQSEVMLGYPQVGLAFIMNNYSDTVMRVQKFPVKTAQEFVKNEGRNFQPVPYVQPSTTTIPIASVQPTKFPFPSYLNKSLLFGAGIALLVFVMVFLIRKRRKNRQGRQVGF